VGMVRYLQYKSLLIHNKNEFGVDFFVGDIQGCYTLLMTQLKGINFNFLIDRLFCTGDLVDKGPESEECINLLKQSWFFCVLGNHDLFFIESTSNEPLKKSYHANYGNWSKQLFTSIEKVNDLALLMILKMPLCRLIKSDNGLVGIAHAGFPEDISKVKSIYYNGPVSYLFEATSCRALFSKPDANFSHVHALFLGHNSVNKPVRTNNIVWLDTVHTGRLSIVKLCDVEFIPTHNKESL
jgi:serine/threonine protein phosphatase 1